MSDGLRVDRAGPARPTGTDAVPATRAGAARAAVIVWLVAVLATLVSPAAVPRAAADAQVPDGFVDVPVVTGFAIPVGLAFLPDGRLLLTELRSGKVRMIVNGMKGAIDPLLTVDSLETLGGERGLTGIAVDPEWPQRPYLYVVYSVLGNTIRISRYTATGDLYSHTSSNLIIDPATRLDILRDIPDQLVSHNGGTIRFGTDEMLYASFGDDQTSCTAQDSVSLRGVILRLDVSGLGDESGIVHDPSVLVPFDNPLASHPDVRARLVWATGVRNPFRFHVDPFNGDLFIADVGPTRWEEVTRLTAGGANLGWPLYEGPDPTGINCGITPTGPFTPPDYAYNQADLISGSASVISAGVYRPVPCHDCGFPIEYDGSYFFSDFFEGFLRRLVDVGGTLHIADPVPGQPSSLDWGEGFKRASDFAWSPDGDLYYCRTSMTDQWTGAGDVRRVTYLNSLVGAPEGPSGSAGLIVHPSPARSTVHFSFAMERSARVVLDVFDAGGRRVYAADDVIGAGRQMWTWDGRDLHGAPVAPGVYLARLARGAETVTKHFVVIR